MGYICQWQWRCFIFYCECLSMTYIILVMKTILLSRKAMHTYHNSEHFWGLISKYLSFFLIYWEECKYCRMYLVICHKLRFALFTLYIFELIFGSRFISNLWCSCSQNHFRLRFFAKPFSVFISHLNFMLFWVQISYCWKDKLK